MTHSDPKWYAIYTRPKWEKKVALNLEKKQVENYCPLNRVVKQWSDRKKLVFEPLFSSYVFVRIDPSENAEVRNTEGVINFVYWLGKPAVISNLEIEIIRKFLNEYQNVQFEKTRVDVNDRVKILRGPLMAREGSVVAINNSTVKVYLPHLGYLLVAEIEKGNLEKINILSGENDFSFVH